MSTGDGLYLLVLVLAIAAARCSPSVDREP
jgi:hypothetical protein